MDEKKLNFIGDIVCSTLNFLLSFRSDEIPENSIEDLQTALDYLNEFKEERE